MIVVFEFYVRYSKKKKVFNIGIKKFERRNRLFKLIFFVIVCVRVRMCVCARMYVYVGTYACVCVCVRVYVGTYVCVCACFMYIGNELFLCLKVIKYKNYCLNLLNIYVFVLFRIRFDCK